MKNNLIINKKKKNKSSNVQSFLHKCGSKHSRQSLSYKINYKTITFLIEVKFLKNAYSSSICLKKCYFYIFCMSTLIFYECFFWTESVQKGFQNLLSSSSKWKFSVLGSSCHCRLSHSQSDFHLHMKTNTLLVAINFFSLHSHI